MRHDIWCPDDFWVKAIFLQSIRLSKEESAWASCYPVQVTIKPDTDWIEVDSAFGGLALYQVSALLESDALYQGVNEEGVGVCEHVPLHRSIRSAGGRIFINPAFLNAKYTEHTRQLVGKDQLQYIWRSLKNIVVARTMGHIS